MSEHDAKLGRLLLLSQGEYSSYERLGWYIVVQPFNSIAVLAEFLNEKKLTVSEHGFESAEFVAWVIRKGLIAEIEEFFDEWYLGDYGRAAMVELTCASVPTELPQSESKP